MKNSQSTPVAISEWYRLKDNPPTELDHTILVYWEYSDGTCNIKTDFYYYDDRLLDEDFEPVTDQHILETAIWCYWPDPMQNNSNKEA